MVLLRSPRPVIPFQSLKTARLANRTISIERMKRIIETSTSRLMGFTWTIVCVGGNPATVFVSKPLVWIEPLEDIVAEGGEVTFQDLVVILQDPVCKDLYLLSFLNVPVDVNLEDSVIIALVRRERINQARHPVE